MLKIKDNVDLKELEKFGFKFLSNKNEEKYKHDTNSSDILFVDFYKRTIYGLDTSGWSIVEGVAFDVLFDLIQAGLIEKVEEKNK